MDQGQSLPTSFYCPLTHDVMKDPVIDHEGNSYERSAIEEWLKNNSTSPITRSNLTLAQLAPNRALRDAIEEKIKQNHDAQNNTSTSTNSNSSTSTTTTTTTTSTAAPAPVFTIRQDANLDDNLNNNGDKVSEVSLEVQSQKKGNIRQVLASVKTPTVAKRPPADVVCIIDISGSMGEEASIQTETGTKESQGLNLLDIVVHSVKTILASLEDTDRLAVITFETKVQVLAQLVTLSKQNRQVIEDKLNKLEPEDCTNLWGGLSKGLEILKNDKQSNRISSILLLTDGVPTVSPPRGEIPMLKRFINENKSRLPTINTFGFGYTINSELLLSISQLGNGMFTFIPDASFVGTSFVNCMANTLTMQSKSARLTITPGSGRKIIKPTLVDYENCCELLQDGSLKINAVSLHSGQSRDFYFEMEDEASSVEEDTYVKVVLEYEKNFGAETVTITKDGNQEVTQSDEIECHKARYLVIAQVLQALKLASGGVDKTRNAIRLLEKEIPQGSLLGKDVSGQIQEAFSKQEYYKKWGRHYLPSLMRSHLLQQCNNFKDQGIQKYGGVTFGELRDKFDDVFLNVPAPVPKQRKVSNTNTYGAAAPTQSKPARPINMNGYINSYAPCFDGNNEVVKVDKLTNQHTTVKLRELNRGDWVIGTNSHKKEAAVEIDCLLITVSEREIELCELGQGLIVTPWHPVMMNGKWSFPADLVEEGKTAHRKTEGVYSFVLKNGAQSVKVNGWEGISLGHGEQEDSVARHEYWGTEKVVDDLKKMQGWAAGRIVMSAGAVVRGENGLVNGLNSDLECSSSFLP